jgi:hypothetical protein
VTGRHTYFAKKFAGSERTAQGVKFDATVGMEEKRASDDISNSGDGLMNAANLLIPPDEDDDNT